MTAAPLMPEIDLDPHAPAEDVRAFFERDRFIAAYALADLDPENVDQSRWWVARRGDDVVAAALLVEVLPFRPCFAMGDSQALAELFRSGMTEPRLILATPPNGRLPIEASYRFERIDVMHRMVVDLKRFQPRVSHPITRLTVDELEDVIDLYGNASRTYFTPERMRREMAVARMRRWSKRMAIPAGGVPLDCDGTGRPSRSASIFCTASLPTSTVRRSCGHALLGSAVGSPGLAIVTTMAQCCGALATRCAISCSR